MRVVAAAVALAISTTTAHARPLRVLSLDQCADQYALALAPDAVLALSPRADDSDSWLRREAAARPRLRPTLEAAIVFRPDVVIRTWGGDARLLARLDKDGTKVVSLQDASDFRGVRRNVRVAARGLERARRGEALVARMDSRLAEIPKDGLRGEALYLTAGGFSAGRGTIIDAILRAAGFANAARSPGFHSVAVERIALKPPARFVLGFFDQQRSDWRGPGRHPVIRRAIQGRAVARLPAATLSCPAWFAADAAAVLSKTA